MDKIVTNPTSTTQWQTLVTEASAACKICLSEEIESYLVFLLMRFVNHPQIAQKIMGQEFMHGINRVGSLRPLALRDVGDQCLLYSGLFPGRAQRRRVRVSYYVNIGKSAYLYLAETKFSSADLFTTLASDFVGLMDILQAMREINGQPITLDPISAEELWHDTGSNHALQSLKKYTSSMPIPMCNLEFCWLKH